VTCPVISHGMCQFVLFSARPFCYKTIALPRIVAIFLTVLLFLMGKGFSAVQDITRPMLPNQNYTETIRGSDMGGGVGGVLYTLVSGQRQFNSYNSRGDVVNTSNDSGNSIWQAQYEALGTRTAERGSNPNRQRANNKDEDPTGLLNEGFRYRDLETGLFITRDPLGFVDGPNVYTYVRQNPWTAWDPLGLYEKAGGGVSNAWLDKSQAIQADNNRSFADSMSAMAYGIGGVVRIIPEATSYAFRGAREGMADARNDINQQIDSGEMNAGVGTVARVGLFAGDFSVGTSELINAPVDGITNTVNGLRGLPGKISDDVQKFADNPSVSGAFDLVEDAANVALLAKSAKSVHQQAQASLPTGGTVVYSGIPIKRNAANKGGIYEFPDQKAGGTLYVGQSSNFISRLKKHESAGRLNRGTEATTDVAGGKTAREIAEHKRIQEITGGVPASKSDAVSNKVDPIGPRRQHLLDKE
jgi:RHS repeat-associated protein